MNKVLVLVVFILIPIAIFTEPGEEQAVLKTNADEAFSLELPVLIEEEKEESDIQVSLSYNQDKSEAFTMDLEEYVIGVVAGEMPA